MSDNPHSESLLPASLRDSFVHVQMRLFPILEDEFGELDDDHRQFVALCQTVEPLFPHGEFAWCGNGRPPVPRLWLLRAFLAKALWNFPTTRALIEELGARPKMRRLCGFDMPGDVPTAMIVTSASVHDSQIAIPLMQRTRESCTVLYDLLDAGYDAEPIRDFSRSLGSVPIIPVNPRRRGEGNGPEMEPDRAERFRKRSGVERFNSHLNDEHGGRTVRVRGHAKVALHLAFGVLVIAVEQVFRLLE